MPLTWDRVTFASRIMLPAHAAFSTLLGLAWLVQNDQRTAVPALYALRHLWPIQATGVILIVVGLVALAGILSHKRATAAIALGMGALAYLLFAVAVAWPLRSGLGSFSAPLWPLYVAFCHVASMVSLALDGHRVRGSE